MNAKYPALLILIFAALIFFLLTGNIVSPEKNGPLDTKIFVFI